MKPFVLVIWYTYNVAVPVFGPTYPNYEECRMAGSAWQKARGGSSSYVCIPASPSSSFGERP